MSVITLPIIFSLITIAVAMYEGVDPNTLSCDPLGQVSLHLPHFTDCSKFYMCAHGKEFEFSCSGGLYFDFNIQTCNWPYNTKCHLRGQKGGDSGRSGGNAFDWSSVNKSHKGSFNSASIEKLINRLKNLNTGTSPGAGTTNINNNLNFILMNMDFNFYDY